MQPEPFAMRPLDPNNGPPRRARRFFRLGVANVALLLAAASGLASAAETLTDAQMDRVAAGYQQSTSGAAAYALLGFAATASSTYASQTGSITSTGSTSAGVAGGIGAGAIAGASTVFR